MLFKIGPNFVGWAVISGNNYEKNKVLSLIGNKSELKTVQVNDYEMVVKCFHISHNLT